MAHIDLRRRRIQAKLVYYGPGLCGKTTNLEYVNKKLAKDQELMSLATEGDVTIFFDFIPLDLGKLRGLDVQFKLYTVPGQVRYNATRKMVLKGVDGIVFVADSQPTQVDANLESLENLFENLTELGIPQEEIAIILQYNKRDLPNVLSLEEMDVQLNKRGYPRYAASAFTGEGVVDTLTAASKLVLGKLARELGETSAGGRSAAAPATKKMAAVPPAPVGTKPMVAPPRPAAPRPPAPPMPKIAAPPAAANSGAAAGLVAAAQPPAPRAPASPAAASASAVAAPLPPLAAPAPAVSAMEAGLPDELRRWMEDQEQESVALREQLREAQQDVRTLLDEQRSLLEKLMGRSERMEPALENTGKLAQVPAAMAVLDKKINVLGKTVSELRKGGGVAFEPGAPPSSGPAIDMEAFRGLADKEDLKLLRKEIEVVLESHSKQEQPSFEVFDKKLEQLAVPKQELAALRTAIVEIGRRVSSAGGDGSGAGGVDMLALRGVIREELSSASGGASGGGVDVEALRGVIREELSSASGGASGGGVDVEALRGVIRDEVASIGKGGGGVDMVALRGVIREEVASAGGNAGGVDIEALRAVMRDELAQSLASLGVSDTSPASKATKPKARKRSQAPAAAAPEAEEPAAPTAEAASPAPAVDDAASLAAEPMDAAAAADSPPAASSVADASPARAPSEPEPRASSADAALPADDPTLPPVPEGVDLASKEHKNAARVARVMIGDLYLYNKDDVDEGLRQNDFYQRNEEALSDIRTTFASRVPEEVRDQYDHLAAELEKFLHKKREAIPTPEADRAGSDDGGASEAEPVRDDSAEANSSDAEGVEAAAGNGASGGDGSSEAGGAPEPETKEQKNAARVARVMIGDLYLYHRDEVEEGIRQGDFYDRNQEALNDMRATYEARIPEDVRNQGDFLAAEIEKFIQKKREQLGV